MISRLIQLAHDSRYQRSLKNVYRDGMMPSVLFNRFQIEDRSNPVKFEKTSPLCTRPLTIVLSFDESPGASSWSFSTICVSILSILARSCPTSEDQYRSSLDSAWTISCERNQHHFCFKTSTDLPRRSK